ncbi:MAG: hypothetical protein SVU24_09045 [Pseudomonadota bacterium]|jgi:hypothetical protein|nr:hypothetical protein [Pseudomonadota bacterium]
MSQIRQWLRQQAQNPRRNLNLLLCGAGLFFTGVGAISFAQHRLPPGLEAELLALFGLILAAAGSILALMGYLGLSVLRIWHILDDDDEQHREPPP